MKGKVSIVTGASSGIGEAIAKKFHHAGSRVVFFGRDEKKLKRVTKGLKGTLAVQGDVCHLSDLDKLYLESAKLGGIDVLVANAGIAESKPLKDVDEAFFDAIIDTNYKGLYFTIQKAFPYLNKGASIILISSMAAHIAWPLHSVYSSAKAAVSNLAKSLSYDLLPLKVRVNAISPGFIITPMYDKVPLAKMKKFTSNIPAGRFGTPQEIADVAFFLVRSPYIMGSDIVIDGGMSAIYPVRI